MCGREVRCHDAIRLSMAVARLHGKFSMPDTSDISDLMSRVRSGDSAAAAECVRRFEPEIRRAARVRMTDPRLRRLVDSVDICQSVFGRFFVHAANGSLDLERPEQLLALLVTMTRNRVTDLAREQTAEKRDVRRILAKGSVVLNAAADGSPGPGSVLAGIELVQLIRSRLNADELDLVERRDDGQQWQQIAAELGGSADGLRKKLERALERVREELGVT